MGAGRRLLVSETTAGRHRLPQRRQLPTSVPIHKTNAANGYNNLGINLILIGQWDRAQEALERAFALATEVDERGAKVPMILDSLGEFACCAAISIRRRIT